MSSRLNFRAKTGLGVLVILLFCIDSNNASSDKFSINQDVAEMWPRPACLGKMESIRYASMLYDFIRRTGSDYTTAIDSTNYLTAGHGGDKFKCYIMNCKPVYHMNPVDVIDLFKDYGIKIVSGRGAVYLMARADLIDDRGDLITSDMVGGEKIYVFPSSPSLGEIERL